jgi:hypothetical protein
MALLIQLCVISPCHLPLPLGWDNYLNASRTSGVSSSAIKTRIG